MVKEKSIQSPYTFMDGCSVLNASLKKVLGSIVPVTVIESEPKKSYIRLEEATFHISDKKERLSAVVTAHDLNQYINKFYSIKLMESRECLLDVIFDWNFDGIDLSNFDKSKFI